MLNDYDRLLREYNVPPGVLTEEELRMLREGGIPEDDDNEDEYIMPSNPNERVTQPRRLPNFQVYEN